MPCTLVHANGGANLHRLPAEVHALAKALKRPVGSLTNKILNLEGFRANGARVETELCRRPHGALGHRRCSTVRPGHACRSVARTGWRQRPRSNLPRLPPSRDLPRLTHPPHFREIMQIKGAAVAHETVKHQGRIAPDLILDDIRAVLAYTHDRIQADDGLVEPSQPVSPRQFYAEITKRADVSELMRRLAR
ncbi:MAG TPA: hypothetical protein VFH48_05940 [Chloroflexota bacterium]|nr:hypothetical protein [Chloroflexota bacterium]